MKKDKKKECSFCKHAKKMKESYARQGSIENYLKELAFGESKPFKVLFTEGMKIKFKKDMKNEKTDSSKKNKKDKSNAVKSLKDKMPAFKKKYNKK